MHCYFTLVVPVLVAFGGFVTAHGKFPTLSAARNHIYVYLS
jgi:hypothetical protein